MFSSGGGVFACAVVVCVDWKFLLHKESFKRKIYVFWEVLDTFAPLNYFEDHIYEDIIIKGDQQVEPQLELSAARCLSGPTR